VTKLHSPARGTGTARPARTGTGCGGCRCRDWLAEVAQSGVFRSRPKRRPRSAPDEPVRHHSAGAGLLDAGQSPAHVAARSASEAHKLHLTGLGEFVRPPAAAGQERLVSVRRARPTAPIVRQSEHCGMLSKQLSSAVVTFRYAAKRRLERRKIVSRWAPVEDAYLLTVQEPEPAPLPGKLPISVTVVHCRTLLHTAVPQPDGGRMYRCVTEFPRTPGAVVPVSTLTYELGGGRLWSQVADWEAVVRSVIHLAAAGDCDALRLGLPALEVTMLASGPNTRVHYKRGWRKRVADGSERTKLLRRLEILLRDEGEYFPGEPLVAPPDEPMVMPYEPVE